MGRPTPKASSENKNPRLCKPLFSGRQLDHAVISDRPEQVAHVDNPVQLSCIRDRVCSQLSLPRSVCAIFLA